VDPTGRCSCTARPDASLAGYDKVILDPVTVWRAPGAGDAVSRADLQRLADLLYGMLLTRLKTYYVMVQTPGPKTLRIRAALTEAAPSSTTMDIMSQLGPITGTASKAKEMATGTPAWVGAASAEIQVLDAETGKELYAAADRRVGEKTLTGSTDTWGDVTDTFRVWSGSRRRVDRRDPSPGGRSRRAERDRNRSRLTRLAGGARCPAIGVVRGPRATCRSSWREKARRRARFVVKRSHAHGPAR